MVVRKATSPRPSVPKAWDVIRTLPSDSPAVATLVPYVNATDRAKLGRDLAPPSPTVGIVTGATIDSPR